MLTARVPGAKTQCQYCKKWFVNIDAHELKCGLRMSMKAKADAKREKIPDWKEHVKRLLR